MIRTPHSMNSRNVTPSRRFPATTSRFVDTSAIRARKNTDATTGGMMWAMSAFMGAGICALEKKHASSEPSDCENSTSVLFATGAKPI